MKFSMIVASFLYLTVLTASGCCFELEEHLNLDGFNFAFIGSFCGNASGPLVQYNFSYPQEYCCFKLLSYFQDQWWKIWPKPELECHDKVKLLDLHGSQVLNLTANSSLAGCRAVSSGNGSNDVLCQGSQIYQVQTEDVSTKKCWYLALSNCNSMAQGIRMDYLLNITGATPNVANYSGYLLVLLLSCLIITCLINFI